MEPSTNSNTMWTIIYFAFQFVDGSLNFVDDWVWRYRISDYIHSIIGEAIEKFALLLPGNLKKMAPNLAQLEQWISISIDDINSEIEELMSK